MGQAAYPGNRFDVTERAGNKPGDMAAAADQVKRAATEQVQEIGENAKAVTAQLETALRSSLKTQPMATVAVVAALGFVLGAIWKR